MVDIASAKEERKKVEAECEALNKRAKERGVMLRSKVTSDGRVVISYLTANTVQALSVRDAMGLAYSKAWDGTMDICSLGATV